MDDARTDLAQLPELYRSAIPLEDDPRYLLGSESHHEVKTTMKSFVVHLPGGHDIPLDSILPTR